MKRIVSLLLLSLLSISAFATEFKEGVHYKVVGPIATEGPVVKEYFSFYCGHCYQFEHMVSSIKKHLPEGARFEKSHVDFLGFASKKMQQMLTRALITAEKMNVADEQIASIFKYIHVHRAVPTSQKDIRNIFVLNGADGNEFDRLMASEEVANEAALMKTNQDTLSGKKQLTSVPSVVINGKYMVDPHGLDRNNLEAEYNALVKYLLTLK